ncbi:CPBP family intramembrane glutamic endopeptidase [Haloarchaeobius litoreus]|uniref:CPBP family intramembrane glutamic endopeptidase n=1 Tax=Haloarchaeobius litoreus TaxID=755306 RepID=A0ABD6DMZ3_9EURY|nr:CPBP family intramembrane glutamic endopeptidase [Haloarchaeobius litoreus]
MSADLTSFDAGATIRRRDTRPLLVATVFGLLVSELFVVVGPLETGLFGYVLVLALAAVAGTGSREHRVLLVPATLASCRLVTVGAPDIAGVSPVVVAYVGTFLAVVVLLDADTVGVVDEPTNLLHASAAGVLGLGFGLLAVVVLGDSAASYSFPTSLGGLVVLVALVPLIVLVEELLFRRLLYPALRRSFEPVSAFVATSLLYAVAAPATGQFRSMWLALAAGLLLGLAYEWTRDTVTAVALHAGIVAGLVAVPVVF